MDNIFARQPYEEFPCRTGLNDAHVFEQLYDQYYPVVRDFFLQSSGHPSSLEDLVQETFLRACRQFGQFRGDSTVKTYFLGIARNVLNEEVSARQRTSKERRLPFDDLISLSDQAMSPKSNVPRSEEWIECIRKASLLLPENQKEAFELIYVQGLSPRVAAQRADCSLRTFNNRLYRARRFIKQATLSVSID